VRVGLRRGRRQPRGQVLGRGGCGGTCRSAGGCGWDLGSQHAPRLQPSPPPQPAQAAVCAPPPASHTNGRPSGERRRCGAASAVASCSRSRQAVAPTNNINQLRAAPSGPASAQLDTRHCQPPPSSQPASQLTSLHGHLAQLLGAVDFLERHIPLAACSSSRLEQGRSGSGQAMGSWRLGRRALSPSSPPPPCASGGGAAGSCAGRCWGRGGPGRQVPHRWRLGPCLRASLRPACSGPNEQHQTADAAGDPAAQESQHTALLAAAQQPAASSQQQPAANSQQPEMMLAAC
jgi:hypothetical protein